MILRTVHVGVGGHGQWPIDVMGKDPRFKPVALVDNNPTAARTAQYLLGNAGHKGVPTFSGLTGALSQLEADALVICTPTKTHAEFARMGFAASMHVLVEKGMTMDWNEAKSLVADADASWSKFCVAQNYRYMDCEQSIAYILAKPEHPFYPGKVRIVDYIHHRYRPEPRNLDYPFAMVWDMSCHHVDSLSCWLGPAKRVTARSYAAPWTQYVHHANISAFIEYESGAVCNYVLTHDATMNQWRIAFQGERGALVLTDRDRLRFYPKPAEQLGSAEAQSRRVRHDGLPQPRAVHRRRFRPLRRRKHRARHQRQEKSPDHGHVRSPGPLRHHPKTRPPRRTEVANGAVLVGRTFLSACLSSFLQTSSKSRTVRHGPSYNPCMTRLDVLQEKERMQSVKQTLHRYTVPAAEALIQHEPNGDVRCFACGHRCLVKPGRDGVCRVRFNDNGVLRVPHGYVGALACDPIEKKPFFHVLPGSDALTFGMLGCDYHCGYCFTPDTVVMTKTGPTTFGELFDSAQLIREEPDGNHCRAHGRSANNRRFGPLARDPGRFSTSISRRALGYPAVLSARDPLHAGPQRLRDHRPRPTARED